MLKLSWDDFEWTFYDNGSDVPADDAALFDRNDEEERIRNAAVHCTSIEEIIYCGKDELSVERLSLFLSHQLPKLRCVTTQFQGVCGLSGNLTVPDILQVIASNIETVSISCRDMDEGVFHKFAMANRNLKRIRLQLNRNRAEVYVESARKAVDAAVRLIEDVAVCEMLEEVCISGNYLCSRSPQISETCSALRGKEHRFF